MNKDKLIKSHEESEQYRYDRNVDRMKYSYERNPLEELNNSQLGKTLDWVDLGLDVASITPTPAAPFAAAVGMVTGIPQAIAGGKEYIKQN